MNENMTDVVEQLRLLAIKNIEDERAARTDRVAGICSGKASAFAWAADMIEESLEREATR